VPVTFDLEEEERQAILLALAKLLVERPGWDDFLGRIADKLGGLEMLTKFGEIHGPVRLKMTRD
jgi:hypothetical protein